MNDILKEIKRLLENNQIEDAIKFIDKNLKKKQKAEFISIFQYSYFN